MNGQKQLTKELIGKVVSIQLRDDTRLQYVLVVDIDAIFVKVVFKAGNFEYFKYVPICNILYIDIENINYLKESFESKLI